MKKLQNFALKPGKIQIIVSAFLVLFFSFYVKEGVCAASLFFGYCVDEHGFPFADLISGDIETVPKEILQEKVLGQFFSKTGSFLFNPPAFLANAAIYYIFVSLLFFLASPRKKDVQEK